MSGGAGPTRVGVFLAGVQRSGTTSLFRHMQAHPELAAPRVKETHHFDNETLDWSRDHAARLDEFYDEDVGWEDIGRNVAGRQRFEATPITIFWPPSLARLHRYNPAAKLVLLFRDPVERAYSHWRMEVGRGTEALPFGAAIRNGRGRLPPDDPLADPWRDQSYVERGFYGTQLDRALSLFPRRQLLLLSTERLRIRHREVLGQLSHFLGIAPFGDVPAHHEHKSPPTPNLATQDLPPPTEADICHLRSVFAEEMARFRALSGNEITEPWTISAEVPAVSGI